MSSILSIAYLVVLAGCTAAALLTAIIFLAKKKAGKFLALYAVCVVALLGLGFLVSVGNPVPNLRHTGSQLSVASPGSQNPPAPWAITSPAAPVEIDPADVPDDPVPEPEPIFAPVEDVPAESPAREAAAPLRSSRSTAALAPASATVQEQEEPTPAPVPVPAAAQAQESTPAPAPVALSTYEPMLGDEPEYAPMSNPELGNDPEPAAISNPELWDDGVRQSAGS